MARVTGITLIMLSLSCLLYSQNCVGLQNLDMLNIARQMDLGNLMHVSIKKKSIAAEQGFKFVQLRDTETYVMVPEQYQGRFIDFHALLLNASGSTFTLDASKLTAKITCTDRTDDGRADCKHQRISKSEVGCVTCEAVRWINASALTQRFILIPPYVKL